MARIFLFAVLLAGIINPFRASAATPEIQAVDFYPSGAKFTFTLTTDESGNFEAELPGAFDAGSVKMIDPENFDDVKIFTQSREEWIPASLAQTKAELKAQQELLRGLQTRRSALLHTRELLTKAAPPTRTDAKDIISYIQLSESMKENTENELADLAITIDEETKKSDLLQSTLDQRMPQDSGSLVKVSGHAKSGGTIQFEASTSAANWKPEYTMDLDSTEGVIVTRLYSRASQRTGLDYTGAVTFHTKRPGETVSAPSVNPLRVSIKPQAVEETADYAMPMAAAPRARNMFSGGISTSRKTAAPQMQATLSDHIVEGTGTLTGDNIESVLMLGELELTGKTQLVLIPEQRSTAWLLASMDNGNVPLIPGTAELRVDGQPAGSTSIPEYGINQQKLAFGYAPQISAKKEPIVEKTGSSWFSGGTFAGGYTLKVTNSSDEDREVTVKDRLPIPTDERIELKVKRISPEPKERDRENRLTWELNVKAGETVDILVDYTLSYPSGEELLYR